MCAYSVVLVKSSRLAAGYVTVHWSTVVEPLLYRGVVSIDTCYSQGGRISYPPLSRL